MVHIACKQLRGIALSVCALSVCGCACVPVLVDACASRC